MERKKLIFNPNYVTGAYLIYLKIILIKRVPFISNLNGFIRL